MLRFQHQDGKRAMKKEQQRNVVVGRSITHLSVMRDRLTSEHGFAKWKCCLMMMYHPCRIRRLERLLCCLARVRAQVLMLSHSLWLFIWTRQNLVVSNVDWKEVTWKSLKSVRSFPMSTWMESFIPLLPCWSSQMTRNGQHWMLSWHVWRNFRRRKTSTKVKPLDLCWLSRRYAQWKMECRKTDSVCVLLEDNWNVPRSLCSVRLLGHRSTKWCLFWLHTTVGPWDLSTSPKLSYTDPSKNLCLRCHLLIVPVRFLTVSGKWPKLCTAWKLRLISTNTLVLWLRICVTKLDLWVWWDWRLNQLHFGRSFPVSWCANTCTMVFWLVPMMRWMELWLRWGNFSSWRRAVQSWGQRRNFLGSYWSRPSGDFAFSRLENCSTVCWSVLVCKTALL